NALTGLRAQTANYPGTTVERRVGHFSVRDKTIEIIDLPGCYDLQALSEEERVAVDVITGRSPKTGQPDGAIVVADAMNLSRSLFLVSQIIEMKLPVVVALNMMDLAEAAGVRIDAAKLARALGCPVIPLVARTGRGLGELRRSIEHLKTSPTPAPVPAMCTACGGCRFKTRYAWTDAIAGHCVEHSPRASHPWT